MESPLTEMEEVENDDSERLHSVFWTSYACVACETANKDNKNVINTQTTQSQEISGHITVESL